MAREVTCITKRGGHQNPYERISHVGGAGWRLTSEEAIAAVKRDSQAFYTVTATRSVWLTVAQHEGRDYLTTEADGAEQNNLLALPEC